MWYVEVKALGCTAEIWLNDIPIARVGKDSPLGPFFATPAQHHMVDGINQLTVVIEPGASPLPSCFDPHVSHHQTTQRLMDDGMSVFGRLARYLTPNNDARIGSAQADVPMLVQWCGTSQRMECFPKRLDVLCDLGWQGGPWRWQRDAEILVLHADTRSSVHNVITQIRHGWASGDASKFIHMLQHRVDDCERAYPQSQDSLYGFRAWLRDMARQPDWRVCNVEPLDYALRLCAAGKMIDCITRNWSPIIRNSAMDDGTEMDFPMKLARIAGQWAIVR